MLNIIDYANRMSVEYNLPIYMLNFPRTIKAIEKYNIDLGVINVIDLLPFKEYINQIYHSKFLISDSGTAQEEPSILKTPVIVPRDYTERPESVENYCSFMLNVNNTNFFDLSIDYLNNHSIKMDSSWLGDGTTSDKIINILKNKL